MLSHKVFPPLSEGELNNRILSRGAMRAIQSSIKLASYQQEVVELLGSSDCAIFLDTNVLAWAFRLNEDSCMEFTQWLERLVAEDRLVIPAWVAHEYNHYLFRDDPAFFRPHKAISKQLTRNLAELDNVANLMLGNDSAVELGFPDREHLLAELSAASKTIQRYLFHLDESSEKRRDKLIAYFERLFNRCALQSDVHQLADSAALESHSRFANRLSPGYNDSNKTENPSGDLIIWKEILGHCASARVSKAVLITNDAKSDWVYTPLSVILPNDKPVYRSHQKARLVKLPKPELLAEFERYTGSNELRVLSIESVINILSSSALNDWSATDFRHLAIAIKLDLARTPTEAVVQWFLKHPEKYQEAESSVCNWHESPGEVDQEAFKEWATKNINNIDASSVCWTDVFCELFL
jgi:predicted nucleic acid-binding protein